MTCLTKDQARAEIEKLVAQFEQNETTLLDQDEAMIENNFIRPLFRALNWNVDNRGLAEPQWEFVLQRTTRAGNRPDYILQLDGQALFVMDAKKAKYSMRDPRWLNQVYAYAYSTQNNPPAKKIDFAILTDFQELIVLDCTLYAAKPAAVDAFRVMDWTYRDYVARFDELWELFERDNVRAALRERATGIWARYLSPKKVKANRVPPDRAFLSALDDEKTGWRVRLAKDMKKRNPELRGDVLTAAVQLLIDRIVFVKVLSDREIEDDYLAQMATLVARDGLAENDCGWFVACKNLFAELNAMYNGSIFVPRPELEAVTVSNAVVRALIEDLLPENSPYNFAMLPVEILGTIYERFLGRVVHATDARVKIEDKPEVRKAGGVYYTPQYIVDYIVSQTVGKLLAECKTPADVAQLKILDPACGSGSFLLGAYDVLIEWHIQYYQSTVNSQQSAVNRRASDAYYRDEDGRVRLTAKLKRQILLNNLFGVDIDPQAVEVTRLSLSLKALEDTRSAEAHHERTLFNQTLLPDLSANIQCGNSLIGADYLCVDDAELKKVKPFDWARAFPSVFGDEKPERSLETFQVSDARGFDAVIGNPPYLRIQGLQEFYGGQIEHLAKSYQSAVKRFDLYLLFIERGFRILSTRGRLGFICPHKFINSDFGSGLRNFLLANSALETIISFGNNLIFDQATTYTCLLFLQKNQATEFCYYEFADMPTAEIGKHLEQLSSSDFTQYDSAEFAAEPWVLTKKGMPIILKKLARLPKTLGEITDEVLVGVQSGIDEVHVLRLVDSLNNDPLKLYSERLAGEVVIEKGLLKPFLRGEDVHRYIEPKASYYCIYPYALVDGKTEIIEETELKRKYPKGYAYLSKYRSELTRIRERQKTNLKYWYSCHRSRDMNVFESERIITPYISLGCNMTIAPAGIYHNTKAYSLVISQNLLEDKLYWLGLLNSKVMWFFLSNTGYVLRGGYFAFTTNYMSPFPVRTINFSDAADRAAHDQMVQLVEQMLALHKSRASAQTETDREIYQRQIDATDREIDALVYQLYDLSAAEIAIVEGK
jgi:hypothetical protein